MKYTPEQYMDRLSEDLLEKSDRYKELNVNDTSSMSELLYERKFLAEKKYEWVLEAFKECGVYNP